MHYNNNDNLLEQKINNKLNESYDKDELHLARKHLEEYHLHNMIAHAASKLGYNDLANESWEKASGYHSEAHARVMNNQTNLNIQNLGAPAVFTQLKNEAKHKVHTQYNNDMS